MRAVLVLALALLPLLASAAPEPREIAPGVHLLPGSFVPGRQPDGNSLVLEGKDGLVLVDTGRHAEHTRALIAFATARGGTVAAVFNTHWHLDHIGGNAAVRAAFPDADVLASDAIDGALTGFLAQYRRDLEAVIPTTEDAAVRAGYEKELALLDTGKALQPDVVISESGRREPGGRALDVHLAAHAVTAGDLWLLDRETRTLIAGDLVTFPVPFLDTACPAHWQAALGSLADADFARLVPGHGPVLSPADFATWRRAFDGLLACAATDATPAVCAAGWTETLGPLLDPADRDRVPGMIDYYVAQVLRGDPQRIAQLCGEG